MVFDQKSDADSINTRLQRGALAAALIENGLNGFCRSFSGGPPR
jgi:hypothetical protein